MNFHCIYRVQSVCSNSPLQTAQLLLQILKYAGWFKASENKVSNKQHCKESCARNDLTTTGTSGISSGTSGISSGTSGISSGTNGISSGTNGISSGTSGISSGTSGISSGTSGISSGTSGISSGPDIEVVSIAHSSVLTEGNKTVSTDESTIDSPCDRCDEDLEAHTDTETYIGEILLRHILQLICNAHAITELQVSCQFFFLNNHSQCQVTL